MNADGNLLDQIKSRFPEYSNRQKALARFILANYRQVAFANITALAQMSGVSESTVVRFARTLGHDGYPSLQKVIRRMVRADLDGRERFRLGADRAPQDEGLLARIIRKEVENLSDLQASLDLGELNRVLQAIRGASEVVVVGTRSTASLACHLAFALQKLGIRTRRIVSVDSEVFDELSRLGPKALVVVIGFPRYLNDLISVLSFAKSRGLGTVAITDSSFSPLTGDLNLHSPSESASFMAFHCAPLVLINLIVSELGRLDEEKTLAALARFEKLAEERQYFDRTSVRIHRAPPDPDASR